MNTKRREPLRRLASLFLAGVMMLGICQPVLAAGVSGNPGESGSESGTITVDWNIKGTAITSASSEKEDANTVRVNATPKDWKKFVYRGVRAGDTISFDTRDHVLPFIEAKVSNARDYGEIVPKAELAEAMGIPTSALGSSIPEIRNGNCYLMPDIPNMSPGGSGYMTILAVYRGLSWNGSESVILGSEAIGTEMHIHVPDDALADGAATLTAQWDFYGFPSAEKLYGDAGASDAISAAEKAKAARDAEAEAEDMVEKSNAVVEKMIGVEEANADAVGAEDIVAAAAAGMTRTAVAALSDLGIVPLDASPTNEVWFYLNHPDRNGVDNRSGLATLTFYV